VPKLGVVSLEIPKTMIISTFPSSKYPEILVFLLLFDNHAEELLLLLVEQEDHHLVVMTHGLVRWLMMSSLVRWLMMSRRGESQPVMV
jgi:hypothetical protein